MDTDLGGGLGLAVDEGGPLGHHWPTPFKHVRTSIGPACRAADSLRQAGFSRLATSEHHVLKLVRKPYVVAFGPDVGIGIVGRRKPDDHVAAAPAFSRTDLIAGSSFLWGVQTRRRAARTIPMLSRSQVLRARGSVRG